MVLLESVGTYLDTDNGMTYPANADDTPDMDNPYPLEDIEDGDEWMLALSGKDFDVVANYLYGSVRAFPFFNLLTEK
tara:strand:+ start:874 stop:1104 length:231 start_codon:yes stop_codon:yes gene_type:complete